MGYTRHFMPLIGHRRARAVVGHGLRRAWHEHHRDGRHLMARAIAQKDDEYKRFLPFTRNGLADPLAERRCRPVTGTCS